MLKKIFALVCTLSLVNCSKNEDYIYHAVPPKPVFVSNAFSVKDFDTASKVDILWVIDNSGSMSSIQRNVIANAKIFMDGFLQSNVINWKMGIVSTDEDDAPYLGIPVTFGRQSVDPVTTFQQAVAKLGISGSGDEYVFHNINRVFKDFSKFHRADAHLVVIMVTDEEEQSQKLDPAVYKPANFFRLMKQKVRSNLVLRFYGAISAPDVPQCTNPMTRVPYKDSPFEYMIQQTNGFMVSACSVDFGLGLANIGKDIGNLLQFPRLLLNEPPRPETIKVSYKGRELPPGLPESGGYWY